SNLGAAAEAYQELGDRERAVALIDEAIALRERLNAQESGTAQQRVRPFEAASAAYELRGELALESGDVAAALAYVERGRGRVLLENSAGPGGEAPDEADRREEARHKELLAELAGQLNRAEGE